MTDLHSGVIGSLTVLAVVLTLGLLAWSSLGAGAARVGLMATFITTVIGGLVYSAFSRAAVPAGGPSSATALIQAALLAQLLADPRIDAQAADDIAWLIGACGVAVALSGLMQVLLGHFGLARVARLVPRPVLAGFMNGVALLILVGQLPLLLGLLPGAAGGPAAWAAIQPAALLLGLGTVVLVLLLDRLRVPWLPAALTALAVATLVHVLLLQQWPALALGARIGVLPVQWPDTLALAAPLARPGGLQLLLDHGPALLTTAVLLALIGGLETLLNLLALDEQLGTRHYPQRELQAIGMSNLACGLLGGLPVVMLRARAAAIARAGGRGARATTAGALALALLYTLGTGLLGLMPLPALGGIMVVVAIGLFDRWTLRVLLAWWRGDGSAELRSGLLVMALVCALTVWQGFAAGVALGVLLSMTIFIARMNRSLLRSRTTAAQRPSRRVYPAAIEARLQPQRTAIEVWELEGALFFGNADRLLALSESLAPQTRVLVLDLRRVTTIDETGAAALATLGKASSQRQLRVLLAGLAQGAAPQLALLAQGLSLPLLPDADRAIEAAEQHLLGPVAESTLTARPLASSALLQGLEREQVARVSALMSELRLFEGQTLFHQGDVADGLYVLTLGSVSVISRDGSTTQRFLSISPGMMLGETAMLDGGGRSADAVADTFVILQHLSSQALQKLSDEQPAIAAQIHRNIAVHLSVRLRSASAAWWASQN